MAFLIPDNLKSRRGVPAAISRVASAFEIALDERATAWYEPPFDPAGEKPHLVVYLPNRGVAVLEVLEARGMTGVLGVLRGRIRILRDGREVEIANPLERAEKFAGVLRSRISGEARLSGRQPPVTAGAIFASLTQDEGQEKGLGGIVTPDRCLWKQDVDLAMSGNGEAMVNRYFAKLLGGSEIREVSDDVEKLVRGLIQPDTVIGKGTGTDVGFGQLSLFSPPGADGDVIRVMDRQQEAMAKSLGDGHRVIRGVAGSGKTLVLVYRARLLGRMLGTGRILVTCYTKSLAGQLRELLSEYPNIDVVNLDRLMSSTIRAAHLHFPGYEGDRADEKVAGVALQALERGAGPRYRAVMLDEAQDFCTDALRFALGMLEPGQDDFIVVADSAQNIFRRKFSWRNAGIQAQGRTRILRVNYRNTREILEVASRFLLLGADVRAEEAPDAEDDQAVIPPEAASRSGATPRLSVQANEAGERQEVVRTVKQWLGQASRPRQIAVLHSSSQSGSDDQASPTYS